MAIKPFRRSTLEKFNSKFLKGGAAEKTTLARKAGSSGLSRLQMDKTLKESGYDPRRRREMMGQMLGEKNTKKGQKSGGLFSGLFGSKPKKQEGTVPAYRRALDTGESSSTASGGFVNSPKSGSFAGQSSKPSGFAGGFRPIKK